MYAPVLYLKNKADFPDDSGPISIVCMYSLVVFKCFRDCLYALILHAT